MRAGQPSAHERPRARSAALGECEASREGNEWPEMPACLDYPSVKLNSYLTSHYPEHRFIFQEDHMSNRCSR